MKRITKISFTFLLLLSTFCVQSQVQLGRQVIGSTGGYATGTNISVSSTIGEAVVQTLTSANFILTQGFQQTLAGGDSTVSAVINNEKCRGANNGSIPSDSIKVLGCPGPYILTIRPLSDTTIIFPEDSLPTGDYNVLIMGSNGCTYSIILYVGLDSDEDCLLKFYTGITPNGDDKNDTWIIDNIEMFPENTVKIFNRWGNKVWSGENYDNRDVVWEGLNNEGVEMSDATYFYVAVVEGKTYKGWVELTR